MSVYSTSGSVISLGGAEYNFEESLEKVINEMQQCLNNVQYNLRCVLMMGDQGALFSEECEKSAMVEDELINMQKLFEDLLDVNMQIISIPTDPLDKAYFKKYKNERKAIKKERLKQIELDKKKEKADRKTTKSMEDVME
jgi:hypothetical protein